ncbi:MAG: hypothetical protein QHJ73_18455, partial [Armatimonadota bacterium]|nr:hypothetical protein [Armatimonadota bacterium]
GHTPASEPETRIAQGLVDRHRPVGLLDFHTAHYILLKPHRGDEARFAALHAEINARLKDRYIAQRPYSTEYIQVGFPTMTTWRGAQPSLIFYAAERGTPVSLLVEMSGNRTDTQALVMNVDTVVEICLAMLQVCLQ